MMHMEKQENRKKMGRPRSEIAEAHDAIMDAVHAILQEKSVRDLTMEAVAKRAGVGKPTLYKWWPSKATLVFAMFHERLAYELPTQPMNSVEQALRSRVKALIVNFRGLFGKVMAELIAEGQSDPALMRELYEQHIEKRRKDVIAEIEHAKTTGEFNPDVDSELLVDEIIGPVYYRMLLKIVPLDEAYGDRLIDQALTGVRNPNGKK